MTPDIDVASFRNGDHICFFYRSVEEQFATAVPFVKAGLLRGERCLCVLPPKKLELLRSRLEAAGIDARHEVESGALLLRTPEQAYLQGGSFNREQMVKLLDDAMRESLRMGFTGFRGTGDLSWAVTDSNACGQLPEYEAMLDYYYPGNPALGICMYDASLFTEDQLTRIMDCHRLALTNPSQSKRAIRIRQGESFGDVIFDRVSKGLFHYTVQRKGSSELVTVGQESSLTAAIDAVESTLKTFHRPVA